MKGWRASCWTLVLLGIPAAGLAEFDQCRLIDQVLNRLGNAMAVNRLIIAQSSESRAAAAASDALAYKTRATGAPNANAPKPAATAGNGTESVNACLTNKGQASW